MNQLHTDTYTGPIGEIFMAAQGDQLVFLDFNDNQPRIEKLLKKRYPDYQLVNKPNLLNMHQRLDRYFKGEWDCFDGVTLNTGGTDFQRTVWQALKRIPVGAAISYDHLASNISKPKAVRAAASANANNPIAIIIPCHRVIGKDGSLRGYAGGVDRKLWLLQHEGAMI